MKFQRKLSNGSWIDENRVDDFVDIILEREPWFAPRVKREPMATRQQVLDFLASGKTINYGSDWYAEVRDADAFAPRQPKQIVEVKCDCGHTVAKSLVMSASLGTSCPDCYDRMSG
jgi:hypothetical protein